MYSMITQYLILYLLLNCSTVEKPAEQCLFEASQHTKNINWADYESPRDDAFMTSIILSHKEMQACYPKEAKDPTPFLKDFHFYDVNLDGWQDVVFQGAGTPYVTTRIFMQNEEGDFEQSSYYNGVVTDIKVDSNKVEIIIFTDACCCLDDGRFTYLEYESTSLKIIKAYSLYYRAGTKKVTPNYEKQFITLGETALRTTPKNDDILRTHVCFDEPKVKGNVVTEYEKNATGYIFAKEIDEQGDLWYFVIFTPYHISLKNDFYFLHHVEGRTYASGWVKGTDIEIIHAQ